VGVLDEDFLAAADGLTIRRAIVDAPAALGAECPTRSWTTAVPGPVEAPAQHGWTSRF
jgi:hypothetical protein